MTDRCETQDNHKEVILLFDFLGNFKNLCQLIVDYQKGLDACEIMTERKEMEKGLNLQTT